MTEQFRKIMGGSIAEQWQNTVRNSLGEQMRQVELAIRPLNTIQDTIGQIARSAAESSITQFVDEHTKRHRQMMELLRPKWDQTLAGHALTESLRSIQSFQSLHEAEVLRTQQALRNQFKSIDSLLEPLRTKLPSFTEVSSYWRNYPARVKENLVALAAAGWYLDPEMAVSDIVHFKEDLENDSAEEVSDELAEHFRSSLERIEKTLCADHPLRAHLLKDAFAAHREGKYSLSIPALFAQADGICFDLTGHWIFTGNGVSRFAKRIDPETIERAYLEPLLRAIPIKESSQQRRAKVSQLNRHAVMHGESTDFPTEVNGLKAISFVNFVSHVLGVAVASHQEKMACPETDELSDSLH
ncbi:hypothetical protein EDC50_1266 [Vulcaniibacterium tengchongense]|uniref:Uncharacterized protein n=2 Tax=Vulcaniibacterium tengchongense TaxID=1273429 RepID=A0A3N4W7H7_9GAMM|nr:hypothetical protein EDC50_1266 [Vulcaniibacterium tengchongense]